MSSSVTTTTIDILLTLTAVMHWRHRYKTEQNLERKTKEKLLNY